MSGTGWRSRRWQGPGSSARPTPRARRRAARATAAALVGLVPVVVLAGPAGSQTAAAPPGAAVGHTLVAEEGGCALATLDLGTGVVADLPAAADPDACATDLAVAASGTVLGVDDPSRRGGTTGGVQLVTYGPQGEPARTRIEVDDETPLHLADGGIAVAADGTVYVQMVANLPDCDAGPGSGPDDTVAAPAYVGDSVCLFTLDIATGRATLVGTSGLFETELDGLAACPTGLLTFVPGGAGAGRWGTHRTGDGRVEPGSGSAAAPVGFDCAGTTLYALGTSGGAPGGDAASAAADGVVLGTVDPTTGAFTAIAPLAGAGGDVHALAVAPDATPDPGDDGVEVAGQVQVEVAGTVQVAPTFTG